MAILENFKAAVSVEELAWVVEAWVGKEGWSITRNVNLASWDEAACMAQGLADVYKAASERWDEILEKDDHEPPINEEYETKTHNALHGGGTQ